MWLLYGLLSAVTAALMTIVAKVGLKKIDPTLATAIRSFIMFLFMAVVVFVMQKTKGWQNLSGKDIAVIAVAGAFGALSWLFYFLGLQQTTASRLASMDRLSLPIIILLSILFLGESLSWKLVLGGIFVTAGAILIAIA